MRSSRRRVLALTLGGDQLASSRVRIGTVLITMAVKGWRTYRVTTQSALWHIRFLAMLLLIRPKVTIIQKVVPPIWYSGLVGKLSNRLVFECDDAIQLGYGANPLSASENSRRLNALLPLCDCVIVSNTLLRQDFLHLGAREVVVFPGPVPKIASNSSGVRHGVIWLGSPSTIENVRSIVYPAVDLIPADVEFSVVGAPQNCAGPRITEYVWSNGLQATLLAQVRVGVAPQAEDDWNQRKAFYKVLEYLAAGVVPVVPPHPAVRTLLGGDLEIVAVTARNDTPEAWADAIGHALEVDISDEWITARNRIFSQWSPDRLGQVMLGD